MIIAAHTNADGTFSTAGLGIVRKRLGCRESKAEELIVMLTKLGLIVDLRPPKSQRTAERDQRRFEVRTFGEELSDRVWFSQSLMSESDGTLKRARITYLNDMRQECVYAFLMLHSLQQDEWVSVSPPLPAEGQSGVFRRFEPVEEGVVVKGDHFVQLVERGDLIVFGFEAFTKKYGSSLLCWAIEQLKLHGFLYEVVMAYNRPLQYLGEIAKPGYFLDPEARPIFHVHGGGVKSGLPAEELGVSHLALKMSKWVDLQVFEYECPDKERFVVVGRTAMQIGVAGCFRLRYRVKNPKNRGVGWSWAELMQSENNYRDWLKKISYDTYGVIFDGLGQYIQFEERRQQIANLHT
ncbi:MAG: hypothetical protein Q8K24_02440 [Hydrogenophaga sp.]|nr:hypothetical protein [Hydrogenophaga sp.]